MTMKAPLQEQARHPAAWALDRARRLPASVWGFSRSKPLGGIGLAILVGLVLIGIFRGVIAPYDPERVFNQTTETEDKPAETLRLRGPFTSGTVSELPDDAVTVDDIIVEDVFFLLGTDQLSKDVFSRLVYGAWTATKLSLSAVVLATLAGSIIGLLSGYYGGRLDLFAQRIVDAWLSIPGLILAIAIVGGIGASTLTIIIAISSFLWPATSRVIRSVTLSVKESQYVEAARALGAGDVRIMLRHVLPQTMAPLMIMASSIVGIAITVEAALAFLGVGIPPGQASWGQMLSGQVVTHARTEPLLVVWPGLVITAAVFGANLLGDSLRDVLDPRLRGAQ